MHSGNTTDLSLLRDLAGSGSDSQSWPVFVEKYGPMLFGWCRRWGANRQDSEEIVQETLLVVYRKLSTYMTAPRSNFRSWLKTVSYRIFRRCELLRRRNLTGACGFVAEFPTDFDSLLSLRAREDLSAQLDLMADEEILAMASADVRGCVDMATWQCFELLELSGLPGKAVADQLGLSLGSVITNACRVRKKMKMAVARIELC